MVNSVEVNFEKNELFLKITGFTKSDEQLEILQKMRDNTPKLKKNALFLADLSEFLVTEDINIILKAMSKNLIPQVNRTAIVLPKSAVGTLTINKILEDASTKLNTEMEIFTDIEKASKWLDSL